MNHPPLALYIHWPFCKSKCPYCDFNSHVAAGADVQNWEALYLKEIDHFAHLWQGRTITSIFFGGGTPSLMAPSLVEKIIDHVSAQLAPDAEITLEGNPTSIEAERYKDFAAAGVNRASMGLQSLDDASLRFLGREHSAKEALLALESIRTSLPRCSVDLIYALPSQTLPTWQAELEGALALGTDHLSLYQLTIEKGTPFYRAHRDGEFTLPDQESSEAMYHHTLARMAAHGMPAYEVSNFAKPGYQSQHNMAYWRYDDYLGIGPGAHSRITEGGVKSSLMMHHAPDKWAQAVTDKGHGIQQNEPLTPTIMANEWLMMGLRIREGIDTKKWQKTFGQDIYQMYDLTPYVNEGLLLQTKTHLKPTEKGMALAGGMAERLVGSEAF